MGGKNVWCSRTINGSLTVNSKMNDHPLLLSPCQEAYFFSEDWIARQLGSGYPVEQTNGKVETQTFQAMDFMEVVLSRSMTKRYFS